MNDVLLTSIVFNFAGKFTSHLRETVHMTYVSLTYYKKSGISMPLIPHLNITIVTTPRFVYLKPSPRPFARSRATTFLDSSSGERPNSLPTKPRRLFSYISTRAQRKQTPRIASEHNLPEVLFQKPSSESK